MLTKNQKTEIIQNFDTCLNALKLNLSEEEYEQVLLDQGLCDLWDYEL